LEGEVKEAKLRVFAPNGTGDGPAVHPTSSGWTESQLTWNTKPAATGPAVANTGAIAANSWVEYDVTSLVSGEGAYSFDLVGESSDSAQFSSRESAPNKPQLVITTEEAEVAPSNSVSPTISGNARQGELLTSDPGGWAGTTPLVFARQWQRCGGFGCINVLGATGSTYTLTADDVEHKMRLSVTASNPYGSDTAFSGLTATIVAAPSNLQPPTVAGTARDGETLTATPGSWSGTLPIDYSYQWQRCDGGGCADIVGATATDYTLTGEDVGSTIRVRVTATNTGGSTAAESQPTAAVAAAG
jgi:hypothetical protein